MRACPTHSRTPLRRTELNGIATDVGLSTALRKAKRGRFECLLLDVRCAAPDHGYHLAAIKLNPMQAGALRIVSTPANPTPDPGVPVAHFFGSSNASAAIDIGCAPRSCTWAVGVRSINRLSNSGRL